MFALPLLFLSLSLAPASPAVVPTTSSDLTSLTKELRSGDDWARRRAIEGLAELDTDEAWDLIFETLSDPKAMIADAAQRVLGQTSSATVIDELLTSRRGLRAKSDLVRDRAIEALGRLDATLDGTLLVKPLQSKRAVERRRMCWTVERLCEAGHPPTDEKGRLAKELSRIADRDKDREVRATALLALAALDPDRRQELYAGARTAKEAPLQIAALELSPLETKLETAVALGGSKFREVRVAAVLALAEEAEAGSRPAMGRLLDRLEEELNERLSWRIVSKLQELSGRKTRRDVQAWRAWWKEAQASWEPPTQEEREARQLDAGERSASFVGLPLLSDHLAFLIDLSGSIWQKRQGVARKARVDAELQRALEGLPKTAYFELIPFIDDPAPWRGELTPASAKKVKEAGDWFRRQKLNGKGDYLDAAEEALRIPDVDTQVILGDGAPSGGERWDLKLLVPRLLEQNRFRQVTFDIVLVDPGKYLIQHWERLAAETGGQVLIVDLDG